MKNLFKSFVALFMVVVFVIGGSVPTMAAEYGPTDAELVDVSVTEMENRAGTQVGGMSGKTDIRVGAVLGTCYVPVRAKTIEVTITGVSGIINLEFINQETGDARVFTVIGNDPPHSLEYVSSMDVGNWTASVSTCSKTAKNCSFDIKFYR